MKTALLTIAAALMAVSTHASLIVNGNFSDNLNGWRATPADEVSIQAGSARMIDPVGDGTYLDQFVPLVAGKSYVLEFDAAAFGNITELYTQVVGTGWGFFLTPYASPEGSMEHFKYTFNAPKTGNALLQFSIYGWGEGAALLDNVSLYDPAATPVPEPTTVIAGALLLIPFGASAVRKLRRRSASC